MNRPRWPTLLALAGAAAVALGAYLPWLMVNPTLPADAEIPSVHYTGMDAGLAGVDYLLVALAALVFALHVVGYREPVRSATTIVTSAVAVLACVGALLLSPTIGFGATFVPALGWYLAFGGGVALAATGGVEFVVAAALADR